MRLALSVLFGLIFSSAIAAGLYYYGNRSAPSAIDAASEQPPSPAPSEQPQSSEDSRLPPASAQSSAPAWPDPAPPRHGMATPVVGAAVDHPAAEPGLKAKSPKAKKTKKKTKRSKPLSEGAKTD
jgi:hypothetical protein